eukprot:scaffold7869_cov138-Cylindrotheca_fusiformis.AAC.2
MVRDCFGGQLDNDKKVADPQMPLNLVHGTGLILDPQAKITTPVASFTVGISDDSDDDSLMGAVDTDAWVAQHAKLRERRRNNNRRIEEKDNNDLQDDANNEPPPPNNDKNSNRARKSGKKARRRNHLEGEEFDSNGKPPWPWVHKVKTKKRRGIRQQREAAMAMGAQGGETEEEVMAMQRLVEQQLGTRNKE